MKSLFVAVTLVVLAGGFAPAQAQKLYRYCLLERIGGGAGSAGEMMRCAFDTLAQCMASKSGNTDTCIINPWLTFPRR
jgi:Protein of unknown function (DUF3551)